MIKRFRGIKGSYYLVCGAFLALLLVVWYGNLDRSAAVMSVQNADAGRRIVIIDAGHGGEDGGAVSITGARESDINLDIALKLEAVMGLYGIDTVMIRSADTDLGSDGGSTVSQRKAADLKARAAIVNSYTDPILISIHQNKFSESKYSGAQMFYGDSEPSKSLAEMLQEQMRLSLCPTNMRKVKPADSVYLLEKTDCTAVIVECGFLSNSTEEALLRTPEYQTKISMTITKTLLDYSKTGSEGTNENTDSILLY